MLQNQLITLKGTRKSTYLKEEIIDLTQQTFVIPPVFAYRIVEVTEDQIARPDLISIDVYGTDVHGDIICKLNGISNPFEINAGDKIIVPDPNSLESFNTIDRYVDSEFNELFKPVAKDKKEKRKANEAIVGDVRFKVDATNRVIIY